MDEDIAFSELTAVYCFVCLLFLLLYFFMGKCLGFLLNLCQDALVTSDPTFR